MARLRWKDRFPPGGWMFKQPQTGWSANPHVGFGEVVRQIVEHRRANPRFGLATDEASVGQELEQFTVNRLRSVRGGEQWLVGDAGAPVPKAMPPQRRGGGRAAGVEKVKAGLSLVREWLGDGLEPVGREEAERRAEICAGCGENQRPGFGGKMLARAAQAVAALVEAKHEMRLGTSRDGELQQCNVCRCDLKLKVWVPLEHVRMGTTEQEMKAFPDVCWVKVK